MLNCFKDEELGSGYVVTDTELFLASRKGTIMTNKFRQKDLMQMNVKNPELRSLSIAAFLRQIYASIESAPNADYHKMAI